MPNDPLYNNTPPPADEPAASRQGWDSADFTCGRCHTTVTGATQDEFVKAWIAHRRSCITPSKGSYRVRP